MNRRLMILFSTAALLAAAILPAAAAPLAGPCAAGGAYDPACDVNQNGVIDVLVKKCNVAVVFVDKFTDGGNDPLAVRAMNKQNGGGGLC